MKKLRIWLKLEDGQGMIEYALLIAFIALGVIAALLFLGPRIANLFNDAANAV